MSDKIEFNRPFHLNKVIDKGHVHQDITANSEERNALADRFDYISIEKLSAHIDLKYTHETQSIKVQGKLYAEIEQPCRASLRPVAETVKTDFTEIWVMNEGVFQALTAQEEEESEKVILLIENESINLGEVVAQNLALAADPFPRDPDYEIPSELKSSSRKPFGDLKAMIKAQKTDDSNSGG